VNATAHGESRSPKPPVLKGFEHIRRFWNPRTRAWTAKILPGQYFVTRSDEVVTTVLGSCISVCMRDASLRVGGMNHFMLPVDRSTGASPWIQGSGGLATRYGSYAMESLINELMKLGAVRERLEVKLFGGARILSTMTDVGAKNIQFAREFLELEHFTIMAEDVGDTRPRHVDYYPATGRVMLKHLQALSARAVASEESRYGEQLGRERSDGDVELFDQSPGH
jgi:chemotaxis protein CheD